MRVAALELAHRFGDVDGALERVEARLDEAAAAGVDLALLPELALTGYVSPEGAFDVSRFAEPHDGPTARALADLARRHRIALAGPLVERDGARLFNALLLFGPTGELVARYRKRHPWYPERWASPGDLGTPVAELAIGERAARVTMAICFDVHFVSDDAAAALDAADVLLFPSAWVEASAGEDQRDVLLPALARRHGVWIANANWAESVPALPGQGGSRIVDPSGRVVARARAGGGDAIVVGSLEPR